MVFKVLQRHFRLKIKLNLASLLSISNPLSPSVRWCKMTNQQSSNPSVPPSLNSSPSKMDNNAIKQVVRETIRGVNCHLEPRLRSLFYLLKNSKGCKSVYKTREEVSSRKWERGIERKRRISPLSIKSVG